MYANFASQAAMNASAPARLSSANAYAVRVADMPGLSCWTTWFQSWGAVATQKRAASVWSAVRTVLSIDPTASISRRSRAYRRLPTAGGGGGRSALPERSRNGVTLPQPGSSAGRNAGGVGTQAPGPETVGAGVTASAPSCARSASTAAATASPTATPVADGSASIASAYCASSAAR